MDANRANDLTDVPEGYTRRPGTCVCDCHYSQSECCNGCAPEGETCQVCGNHYGDVYWLPDSWWALITPKPENPEAGLLCPDCALTRLRTADLAGGEFQQKHEIEDVKLLCIGILTVDPSETTEGARYLAADVLSRLTGKTADDLLQTIVEGDSMSKHTEATEAALEALTAALRRNDPDMTRASSEALDALERSK